MALVLFGLGCACQGNASLFKAEVEPMSLRCEYLKDPLGIDVAKPRLSWVIADAQSEISNPKSQITRSVMQAAYQVLVASAPELLAKDQGDLWDSGKVESDQSIQVEYKGKPLESRMRCFWKVRVWLMTSDLRPPISSPWSQPAFWTMGLLKPDDWQAQWISDPVLVDPTNRPMTPIHCYRSELASRPDVAKWIVLDLGTAKRMDAVDVIPARPEGQSWDFRTPMFPEHWWLLEYPFPQNGASLDLAALAAKVATICRANKE